MASAGQCTLKIIREMQTKIQPDDGCCIQFSSVRLYPCSNTNFILSVKEHVPFVLIVLLVTCYLFAYCWWQKECQSLKDMIKKIQIWISRTSVTRLLVLRYPPSLQCCSVVYGYQRFGGIYCLNLQVHISQNRKMNVYGRENLSIFTSRFSSTYQLHLIIKCSFFFTEQGTTGSPKGALLSHHNLINSAMQIGTRLELDIKVRWFTSLLIFKTECRYVLTYFLALWSRKNTGPDTTNDSFLY
jgi:hypothetical protein